MSRLPIIMALIKCSECGGKVSDKAKACPHCGITINQSTSYNPIPKLRIVRKGSTPLVASITLEIRSNGQSIGIYPFNVGFDMEIPVASDMELVIKCQGTSTPIRLTLNPNKNYTCKIGYSTGFYYQLYNENNELQAEDKLTFIMWIICFLIPLIGFFYYIIDKKDYPASSRSALMAALCGIGSAIAYVVTQYY